jgi:hypothetical protein
LAPEEMHTFQAFEAPGWICRMFYPSTALMRRALNELGHNVANVRFPHPAVPDAELAAVVRRLTHTLLHSPSALERESQLVGRLRRSLRGTPIPVSPFPLLHGNQPPSHKAENKDDDCGDSHNSWAYRLQALMEQEYVSNTCEKGSNRLA